MFKMLPIPNHFDIGSGLYWEWMRIEVIFFNINYKII